MLVLFSAGGDVEGRRLEEGGEEDEEEEDQEHVGMVMEEMMTIFAEMIPTLSRMIMA